ncbi:hypothetical protein BLNAU_132 [Blattamonas nauphoetae]|uniref:Uncharacterized protein n=1 Tax=Blattamonas nauphoetae TaxID=2049346 RepID=A0ABQ9YM65_9EUKA|nr:hypothetical protein BLNAU_132 [Blattamonas nauphoetae]
MDIPPEKSLEQHNAPVRKPRKADLVLRRLPVTEEPKPIIVIPQQPPTLDIHVPDLSEIPRQIVWDDIFEKDSFRALNDSKISEETKKELNNLHQFTHSSDKTQELPAAFDSILSVIQRKISSMMKDTENKRLHYFNVNHQLDDVNHLLQTRLQTQTEGRKNRTELVSRTTELLRSYTSLDDEISFGAAAEPPF